MKQLEALCRENSEQAVAVLTEIMLDSEQPAAARLAAAQQMLDRGHGKPIDRQAILNMGEGANSNPERLTEAQLLRIASGALAGVGGTGSQVIDLRTVSDEDES